MECLDKKEEKKDVWSIAYLLIFGLTFANEYYFTTMLPAGFLENTARYFYAALLLYVVAKIIFSKQYELKDVVIAAIIVGAFGLSAVLSGYIELIQIGLLIAGAKNVDFKKILKVYVIIGLLMMTVALVLSQTGVIVDIITYTPRKINGGMRHSYGSIYPTDFAAHVFYLIMAIACAFEWGKKKWMLYVATLVISGLVMYKCLALTTTICLVMFVVLAIVVELALKRENAFSKIFEKVLELSPIILALVFFVLCKLYTVGNAIMEKINVVLSKRVEIGNSAFEKYNIKLFGQFIKEQGWGGLPEGVDESQYFFLDDSYIRILLEYGLVLFIVVMVLYTLSIKRAFDKKQTMIAVALVAIGMHSFMEHHYLEVAYNPFVYFALASVSKATSMSKTENIAPELD